MVGICRLCASLKNTKFLLTIEDAKNEICQKLRQCFHIEMQMDNVLSTYVCNECNQMLNQSFKFYKKVLESQESLASLFPTTSKTTVDEGRVLSESLLKAESRSADASLVESDKKNTFELQTEAFESDEVDNGESDSNIMIEVYQMLDMNGSNENLSDGAQTPQEFKELEIEEVDAEETIEYEEFKNKDENILYNDAADTNRIDSEAENEEKENDETHLTIVPIKSQEKERYVIMDNFELEFLSSLNATANDSLQSHKAIVLSTINEWSEISWCCISCTEKATSYNALIEHMRTVHESDAATTSFKCADCAKIFTCYSSFLNHIRARHHYALALRCDACDQLCDDYDKLAHHRQNDCSESEGRPQLTLCNVCGKAFRQRHSLKKHTQNFHENAKKKMECRVCNVKFKFLNDLQEHQRTHSKESKKYVCDICNIKFQEKATYLTHRRNLHILEKTFVCNVCDRSYVSSANLQKHALVHTTAKPFKCGYCEKAFRTKDTKLSHERIHNGETPFQCQYCQKRFRFRSTYVSHILIHTGEKRYSCPVCERRFANWSNYNKHLKRMHNTSASGKASSQTIGAVVRKSTEADDLKTVMNMENDGSSYEQVIETLDEL